MGVVGAYIVLGGVAAVEEPADSEDDEPYWCEGQGSSSVGFLSQQHEDEHEERQYGPAHAGPYWRSSCSVSYTHLTLPTID